MRRFDTHVILLGIVNMKPVDPENHKYTPEPNAYRCVICGQLWEKHVK